MLLASSVTFTDSFFALILGDLLLTTLFLSSLSAVFDSACLVKPYDSYCFCGGLSLCLFLLFILVNPESASLNSSSMSCFGLIPIRSSNSTTSLLSILISDCTISMGYAVLNDSLFPSIRVLFVATAMLSNSPAVSWNGEFLAPLRSYYWGLPLKRKFETVLLF